MRERQIHTYARELLTQMGDRAEVWAAQQMASFEEKEEAKKLMEWQRIRSALIMMRHAKGDQKLH